MSLMITRSSASSHVAATSSIRIALTLNLVSHVTCLDYHANLVEQVTNDNL
ncbi:hypothetical protein B296_00008453 [Ensete ventricosum]|uniref:Uncharacterized protein n=1 Tax=Ensete ventricosum TaxID=4639 RepID=A0A427B7U8_ENSVE|nr:hypothetical protein B296_00008453 [Ensete ventricosum]